MWLRESGLLGIVRRVSQALEEGKQLICGSIRSSLAFDRCGLCQDFFLQSEIRIEVDLRCLDGLMAQPKGNERTVYSCLKEFHSCRMSKYMWRQALLRQGGTVLLRHGGVFGY